MRTENLTIPKISNSRHFFGNLSVSYLPEHLLPSLLHDTNIFAILRFGKITQTLQCDPRIVTIGLPQLNNSPLVEVWRSNNPCAGYFSDDFYISKSADLLIGHLRVDEDTLKSSIEADTFNAYNSILQKIAEEDCPHLLRMWNYFPKINSEQHQLERYRGFCAGRSKAFEKAQFTSADLPAASAIGTDADGFVIFFLAANTAGTQVENPSQVSAFKYPIEYGPRSPSFSRATLHTRGKQNTLYISGTASIVGHQSVHQDSIEGQFSQTIENINSLLTHSHKRHPYLPSDASDLSLIKCYIRHNTDYPYLLKMAKQRIGKHASVLFLKGDICRQELLLEIEAISYS